MMDAKMGLNSAASTNQAQRRTTRENQAETKRAWMDYESQVDTSAPALAAAETTRSMPEMPIRNFLRVVFVR